MVCCERVNIKIAGPDTLITLVGFNDKEVMNQSVNELKQHIELAKYYSSSSEFTKAIEHWLCCTKTAVSYSRWAVRAAGESGPRWCRPS